MEDLRPEDARRIGAYRLLRLAVSHGPANGPDEALCDLVETLARRAGWELK